VRAVTLTEPEWDDEQRHLLLAWIDWDADRGPHGYSMREATSPEADPNNRKGTLLFKPDAEPIVDFVEQAKAGARKAYEEKYPDANMAGLIFPVRRFEREPQKTPRRKHGGSAAAE
jgi:hypothetical protein